MSYTKTKDTRHRLGWDNIQFQFVDGKVYTNSSSNRYNFTFSNSKTGDYLPLWRNIISNMGDATTAFSARKQSVEVESGSLSHGYRVPRPSAQNPLRWDVYRDSVVGVTQLPSMPSWSTGADLVGANNQALTKLFQDIRRIQTQFQGLTFLGELREAVSMIRRPAQGLRNLLGNYLTTLNNRKRRAPKHRLRQIMSETWLEYSFGWTPLISDTIAAAEALARFNEEKTTRETAKGWGARQSLVYDLCIDSVFYNYLYYLQQNRQTATAEVKYKVGLYATTTAPAGSAERLIQLCGFTPQEFIPTAWELIPWSFVVDYFTNVGDILMSATTGRSDVYRKTKTTRTTVSNLIVGNPNFSKMKAMQPVGSFTEVAEGDLGYSLSQTRDVTRTSPSVLGIPTLEWKFPLSSSPKWINLGALSSQHRSLIPFTRK